jgi:hypothetical protein
LTRAPINNGKCATSTSVYLLSAQGERQITHGKLDAFPAFMPDGGLTWTSEDTSSDQIWAARIDGSRRRPVSVHTAHAASASGRWQPLRRVG